jgi:predicted transcriptional regulator
MKEESATQVERIERLLALLLIQNMKTANMAAKAKELSIAGFTNVEIADILGTTAAVIAQSLYAARKGTKKAK